MTNITFYELSLNPLMQKAIDKMGFVHTTGVQEQTIPIIREGKDILAQSRTGTGKTLAFSIPAIECIEEEFTGAQVLVLSPTRELAQQCAEEIRKLSSYMPFVQTAEIFGGADYNAQFKALRKANIVIGTPGRIMDHMKKGTLKLSSLKMIILDEADEMLNMGFKEDIETILKDVPENRQTLLFSATIPNGILEITHEFQKDPVQINLVQDKATLKEIKQVYVDVPPRQKFNALKLLLFYYRPYRSIIFANTKSMVDELTEILGEVGLSARGLHGDMKQNQRTAVMREFKNGRTEILVATDVAARGIDVSDIDYVFNFDVPKMTEYYVHRIGRTGRAGRTGTAITICSGRQQIFEIKQLSKKTSSNIDQIEIPTIAGIEQNNLKMNIEKVSELLSNDMFTENQNTFVETLLQQGFSGEQIALALVGLAFPTNAPKGVSDVPKVRVINKDKSKPTHLLDNKNFGDIVIDIGASSRVKPDHIVRAIADRTGISSKYIGKIKVSEESSTVGVPHDMIDEILVSMRGIKICGKPIKATRSHKKHHSKTHGKNDFRKFDAKRPKKKKFKD